MRRPSEQQISIALSWLRHNEGDGGESEACAAVADWLESLEQDAILRSEARKAGIPMSALRRKLQSA